MLVAYISGHGFGHAAREVTILRHLPESVPLTIVSKAPRWFFDAELGRDFTFREASFDVGCVQRDSVTVDVDATKSAWLEVDAANSARRASEIDWLRHAGARVIVTDIAPFPLTLAAELGLPGICVANFTWADIYGEYAGFEAIVDDLREQYARASAVLDTDLSLPMDYFGRRKNVGLVARVVAESERLSNRDAVRCAAGCDVSDRLALVYPGVWGMPFAWETLAGFAGWRFATLGETPVGAPENVVGLPRDSFAHERIVAAADTVVSKAGYGIVGECLANGTPLIYGPRERFAEFAALDIALRNWPGGLRIDAAAFADARWGDALSVVPPWGETPALPAPGAQTTIEFLAEISHAS